MKIGGADYTAAELPEGVLGMLDCMNGHGAMTHIGKGLFVCFECRTIGTALTSMQTPDEAFVHTHTPQTDRYRGEVGVPPPHFMQKLHVIRDEPRPLGDEVKTLLESARPPLVPIADCSPATHQWSPPAKKVVTIEQTSVRCSGCGIVLATNLQGTASEVMAELLKQIPQ